MLTLLVMLLTAINYQNNLVYGVTFWLAMVFVVTVHFTHGNLLGLALQAGPAKTGLSGTAGRVLRAVDRGKARRPSICAGKLGEF